MPRKQLGLEAAQQGLGMPRKLVSDYSASLPTQPARLTAIGVDDLREMTRSCLDELLRGPIEVLPSIYEADDPSGSVVIQATLVG